MCFFFTRRRPRGSTRPDTLFPYTPVFRSILKACEDAGTDLVVIDGAAVARDVAYEAARQADFILIPTKTAVFDTMSMTHTLDGVRQLDHAFAVVLTFVPPPGQETGDGIQDVAGKIGKETWRERVGKTG